MAQNNTILIIEDDEAVLTFLRRGLTYDGYEVDTATDGQSGLLLAREHGQKSPLGGILNELSDVISDAALYLPFGLIAGKHRHRIRSLPHVVGVFGPVRKIPANLHRFGWRWQLLVVGRDDVG